MKNTGAVALDDRCRTFIIADAEKTSMDFKMVDSEERLTVLYKTAKRSHFGSWALDKDGH